MEGLHCFQYAGNNQLYFLISFDPGNAVEYLPQCLVQMGKGLLAEALPTEEWCVVNRLWGSIQELWWRYLPLSLKVWAHPLSLEFARWPYTNSWKEGFFYLCLKIVIDSFGCSSCYHRLLQCTLQIRLHLISARKIKRVQNTEVHLINIVTFLEHMIGMCWDMHLESIGIHMEFSWGWPIKLCGWNSSIGEMVSIPVYTVKTVNNVN